ncbi:hypothetical protein [Cohnella herbarum]|uniref:Response regulator n=1 Tax=Cohnella herbarum TaxID=2728023 RepID=A0A7Z2VIW9_9BACL|nr:hypothetical protein [Cohnella herbarum]QJD84043.1 hypothetical protein HH215_13180 [Cohnella herbarum]
MTGYWIDLWSVEYVLLMPGLNGIELIGAIKSRWPRTVCMMLTGHAEFEYAQRPFLPLEKRP